MSTRVLLVLIAALGLAFGSGPVSAFHTAVKTCGCCPTGAPMECCVASHTTEPTEAPATMPQTVDLKQAVIPVRVFLGVSPQFVVASPSALRLLAARQAATPRLALLCTRLI